MIQPSNHTCSNFMTEQDMLHLEQTNNSNSNLKVIKKFYYSNITNKIIKLNISEKRQGVCNFKIETKNASTKQNMIQLITTFPDWQSQILAVSSVLPVYSLSEPEGKAIALTACSFNKTTVHPVNSNHQTPTHSCKRAIKYQFSQSNINANPDHTSHLALYNI